MSQKGLIEKPITALVENKGWITREYTTDNAMQIFEDFESKFGFIPESDMLMISKRGKILKPYISKSGWSFIANNKGISTTFTVEQMAKTFVIMRCRAILPNGVYHEAPGMAMTSEPGKDTIPKCMSMAYIRARNKALELATNTQNCSWEEIESPEMKQRLVQIEHIKAENLTICPVCKKKGWSSLQKICMDCGITYEEILAQKQ